MLTPEKCQNIGNISLHNLRCYIAGYKLMLDQNRDSDAFDQYKNVFTKEEMLRMTKEMHRYPIKELRGD